MSESIYKAISEISYNAEHKITMGVGLKISNEIWRRFEELRVIHSIPFNLKNKISNL